jgi:hypothetical protein
MLFTYWLDIDKVELRLGIVSSILLAAVVLHLTISGDIPPVGYLTFADKFVLLTYFVALASFILNITLLRLIQRRKRKDAKRIYVVAKFWAVPIIIFLYLALFALMYFRLA